MMRRLTAVLIYRLVALELPPIATIAADRPNILFIFTDDHAPHAIDA